MEKLSKAYLSDQGVAAIREMYSGRNDAGLFDYATARKAADRLQGLRRRVEKFKLGVSRFTLSILDRVSGDTLQAVDRIVVADSGQLGKYKSI